MIGRVAAVVAVAFAVLLVAVTYTLVSVSQSANAGCLRDQRTVLALRTIISRSVVTTKELHDHGQLTDELYARAKEQNRLALESLPVPSC